MLSDVEREGYLFVNSATQGSWDRHWFVLKSAFLYEFKSKEDVMTHSQVIWLQDAAVEILGESTETQPTPFGFIIRLPTGRMCTFYTQTEENLKEWLKAITKSDHTTSNAMVPGREVGRQAKAPTWVPDTDVTGCSNCQSKFRMFRRRHHCRRCGLVFCGSCAGRFCPLPDIGIPETVRVCDSCFSVTEFRSRSQSTSPSPPSSNQSRMISL